MKPILAILSAYHALSGIFMLLTPSIWYQTIPGVTETGPFNEHFIRDIGLAFLASGAALGIATVAGKARRALVCTALVFTGGHAVLHAWEIVSDMPALPAVLRDVATILVPGLLPVIALRKEAGR
jgi:hypothetical protein